jgi:hypothetical protein
LLETENIGRKVSYLCGILVSVDEMRFKRMGLISDRLKKIIDNLSCTRKDD